MSITSAIVRELMAAGLEGEALVAALERIEAASQPALTKRQLRDRRYYENHREEKIAKVKARQSATSEGDGKSDGNDGNQVEVRTDGNDGNFDGNDGNRAAVQGPQDIITQPLKPLSPLTLRERGARLTALALPRRKPNLLAASRGSSLTRPRSILTASPRIGTGSSLPSAASPGRRLGTNGRRSSPTTSRTAP